MLDRWRSAAKQLKTEIYALELALRDPRTPWYARLTGIAVVAYAFSPLDLIPDFIPVLGLVDDLVLVPLGIWFTLRLIPPQVMMDSRARAQIELTANRPANWTAAAVIVLLWAGAMTVSLWAAWRVFHP